MSLLSAIIDTLLSVYFDDKIKSFTDKYLICKLIEELKQITSNYEKKYEMSVMSTGRFCEYIQNHNVIENIFDYFYYPEKNKIIEQQFIKNKINDIISEIGKNGKVSVIDKKIVSSYIDTMVSKIKEFFRERTTTESKEGLYIEHQINLKMDIIMKMFEDNLINISEIASKNIKDENVTEVVEPKYFTTANTLEKLLKDAISEIEDVTHTDYNQIILKAKLDSHQSGLVVFADNVADGKQRYRVVILEGLISEACDSGDVIIVNDVSKETKYFSAVINTKAELVLPIKINNRIIGAINSESEIKNYYTEEIIEKLYLLSRDFSIALSKLSYNTNTPAKKIPCIHIDN